MADDLLDRIRIQELIGSYGHNFDSGDLDAFFGLFSEDAQIDIGMGFTDKSGMMATIKEAFGAYDGTHPRHFVTNLVVDVLESDRAEGRCYFLFTQTIDGVVTPGVTGRYLFELNKQDDRWCIHRWQAVSDRSA